jgi:non-specific serine/threonine protein kinase
VITIDHEGRVLEFNPAAERVFGYSSDEALEQELADKRLLLVLDNFEHVLDAAPIAGGLLAAAPGLRVLATSRAGLRLSGEHEYHVPPLSLPDGGAVADSEAARLFVARARAARPDF